MALVTSSPEGRNLMMNFILKQHMGLGILSVANAGPNTTGFQILRNLDIAATKKQTSTSGVTEIQGKSVSSY
ncbi:hypothetical protein GH733_004335 [Mirounga leonina]|nr:hypothetical protein GH733_004335 [Mirounga leonina]